VATRHQRESFARCHKTHFAAVVCGGCIGKRCSKMLRTTALPHLWRSCVVHSRVVISRVLAPPSLKAIRPIRQMLPWRGLYVCPSITLVHPAIAAGGNEMLFRKDTGVITRNILLDRNPSYFTGRQDLRVGTPTSQLCRLIPNYWLLLLLL